MEDKFATITMPAIRKNKAKSVDSSSIETPFYRALMRALLEMQSVKTDSISSSSASSEHKEQHHEVRKNSKAKSLDDGSAVTAESTGLAVDSETIYQEPSAAQFDGYLNWLDQQTDRVLSAPEREALTGKHQELLPESSTKSSNVEVGLDSMILALLTEAKKSSDTSSTRSSLESGAAEAAFRWDQGYRRIPSPRIAPVGDEEEEEEEEV